jgi:hypothetical protein
VLVCRDIVFFDRFLDGALLIRLVKDDADELRRCAPDGIDRPGVSLLFRRVGRSLGHSGILRQTEAIC